jgi:hypothetical protein
VQYRFQRLHAVDARHHADDASPALISCCWARREHPCGRERRMAGETAVTIAAKRGQTEVLRILRDAQKR